MGGFVGANTGTITRSHATGNASAEGTLTVAGGFAGFNLGDITLAYATGNVTVGNAGIAGGFVGVNMRLRSTRLTRTAAVTGGSNSYVGGFVGVNVGDSSTPFAGSITQSYALGPVTRRQFEHRGRVSRHSILAGSIRSTR